MLRHRSLEWLMMFIRILNEPSVSGAAIPLTMPTVSPTIVGTLPVIPTSPTMIPNEAPLALTILPTTSLSPTQDCDFNMRNASNDILFRNTTAEGDIVATIYTNETFVLPPPSTAEMSEFVFEDPTNGVVFENTNVDSLDSRFIYTPNATFLGVDVFEIDQCLFHDGTDCSGDCRFINIVVHVIQAPLEVVPPGTNTAKNVEPVAPKENDASKSSNGTSERRWGLLGLTILPFVLVGYIFYKYQRRNKKAKNRNSAVTSKSDQPLDDEVGTMIGRIVDVANDDTQTIVSGLHTISLASPNRPLPEQCATVDRDSRPARRLTPIHDQDFDHSVISGSTMSNATANTSGTKTTDPFYEYGEMQLHSGLEDKNNDNLQQWEAESLLISTHYNHNRNEDITNVLNKLQPQQRAQSLSQMPIQESQSAQPLTSTAIVAANTEQSPPPHAQAIHIRNVKTTNDTRDDNTTPVMVDAILISNKQTDIDNSGL